MYKSIRKSYTGNKQISINSRLLNTSNNDKIIQKLDIEFSKFNKMKHVVDTKNIYEFRGKAMEFSQLMEEFNLLKHQKSLTDKDILDIVRSFGRMDTHNINNKLDKISNNLEPFDFYMFIIFLLLSGLYFIMNN